MSDVVRDSRQTQLKVEARRGKTNDVCAYTYIYIYVLVDVSGTKMMIEMFPCPSNRKRLLLAKNRGIRMC